MQLPGDAIWLPGGGELKFSEIHAARAVEEYDAELTLGQRKDTGEWCAFLPGRPSSNGQPFPVISFGTELPTPERIKQLLYEHDIRRNGREILDGLDRRYDAEQKKLRDAASDAAEQVAEVIDSDMRRKGVHPFPRVYPGATKYGGGRVRSSG
jgi:hypothetical protein